MSYIQLPDKIVNKVEQVQLSLPKYQKAKDLLAHLPYISNLQDPILQNRVEDVSRVKIFKIIYSRLNFLIQL